MATEPSHEIDVVAKYDSAAANRSEVDAEILNIWKTELELNRAEIADLLAIDESELKPDTPPFLSDARQSGIGVVEILILVSTHFALGFVEDAAKDLGKMSYDRLKTLWNRYFDRKLSSAAKSRLGQRKK